MRPRLLLPLALMTLTLAWVGSASAISISFLEPISPTVNIGVSTDLGALASVFTSPELATVSVGNVTVGPSTVLLSIGLTEPGTTNVSDLVTVRAFTQLPGFQVSFQSDSETPLTLPPGIVTTLLAETGLPQIAFSSELTLPLVGNVALLITTQSDLDNGGAPVPEPSTLLLFGSSLAGFGAVWRRYRHS
jgi:hypothetical protein